MRHMGPRCSATPLAPIGRIAHFVAPLDLTFRQLHVVASLRRLTAICALVVGGLAWASDDPLAYERVPLPTEENAYSIWQKVGPELKASREDGFGEAIRQIGNAATNLPPPEVVATARAWLATLEEPLTLWTEGTARGKMQFPPFTDPESDFLAVLGVARYLDVARTKAARARLRAEDGQYAAAVDELLEVIAMGRMVADGNGPIVAYLIGRAVEAIGYESVKRLAGRYPLPLEVLRNLQRSLGASSTEDAALAQTYRVEYHEFLRPNLLQIRRDLEQHPKTSSLPLDQILNVETTLETFRPFVLRLIADTRAPWSARNRNIVQDARKQFGLTDDDATDPLEDLLMAAALPQPDDSDKDWQQLLDRVAGHPNVVGEALLAIALPAWEGARKTSARTQAHHELTRALVALERRRLQFHALPDTLEALLTEGLLGGMPRDPFANGPLRYDPARGLLWSVGPDETDEGGDADKDIVVHLRGSAAEDRA